MGISMGDIIEPANRKNTIFTADYFHVIAGADIDFAVEKILESSGDSVVSEVDKKYIVRNSESCPTALNTSLAPGVTGLSHGDMVRYNGNEWEIFKDVSNSETNYGIVYDKNTKLFYQYDAINQWKPLLRSGKIDGGTF